MKRALHFVEITVVLCAAAAVAGFFGRWHFLFDLGSHLRLQLIVALSFCCILMLLSRRRWWAAFSGGIAVGMIAAVFVVAHPVAKHRSATFISNPAYRLYSMNVLSSNDSYDQVIDDIAAQDPTFVALYETTQPWVNALDLALLERWPYCQKIPRNDNFGLVLYSKLPWSRCDIRSFGQTHRVPSIVAHFELSGPQILRLIVTHPLPPISAAYWHERNQHFAALSADVIKHQPAHSIVAGDLNCSPWSPWFSDLLNTSDLADSDEYRGLQSTWNPIGLPLCGLPIDHVLIGSQIYIVERRIGAPRGSDHCPIVIDFYVGNPTNP